MLKEKLNYLQNSEDGQDNNASIIQEIQESDMRSKIEEEYYSSNHNENNENENETSQTNQEVNNKNNSSSQNIQYFDRRTEEDYMNEQQVKSYDFRRKKYEDYEESSQERMIKEMEERLMMEINKKIDQELNQKIDHIKEEIYENLCQNEKKITLLERKLYSFEEV